MAYLERRYGGEPYRLALALLAADLEAASQVDMTARLLDEAPHQARVTIESIQEVLDMIAGAIPREVAGDYLRTVRIQTATFGLHAARLDIREDSGRLAAALGGILDALGIDAGFAERDDAHRPSAPAPPVEKPPRRPTWPWPRSRPRRAPRPGGSSASSRACGASTGQSRSGRSSSR